VSIQQTTAEPDRAVTVETAPDPRLPPFGRFFLPGPTEVRPDVLEAMVKAVIGHRGPDMNALMADLEPGLGHLFRTERPVYVSTSSATGMMEAAITNLSRRRVLCLVCGAFSERFYNIASGTGIPADRMDVEWGEPNLPEKVAEKLAGADGRYDLVTVVHSETSTGVLNPIAEIADVVGEFDDVLLAVDGVTSVAGAPLDFDEWKLDFVVTGSQKALALPPGLALAVASERALERARQVENRGFYFDLLKFEANTLKRQTPNTPAVSLFYALAYQLQQIRDEGLEARWGRHRDMAERTWAWVDELKERTGEPFRVLSPAGYRSPTVTAVTLPEGRDGGDVVAALRERGYTIANGYGKLKGRTIRIGHMGDHTMPELEVLLEQINEVMLG
jgi:predicted phosphoserine aminotransferase